MQYEVQLVAQDALPGHRDLVIVERDGQPPVMLLAGRPAQAWSAMRDYEAAVGKCDEPSMLHAV